jgi:bifunctional non-homologous end joining protein LigD
VTTLTSADKVLWPEAGFTKRDLLDYYERAAERLLPHLAGRPLTLKRYNAGVGQEGFFQKNLPESAPPSVRRHTVWTETSQRHVSYALADDVDDLRYFAQQNAVELHPWFSRVDRPERPDILAFDLDPSEGGPPVARAALVLHQVLGELGLAGAVKTSGKRGLHVYVPVQRRYSFGELRAMALAIGRMCVDRRPEELTVEMRKAERDGRLLLDWSRPGPAQTLVAAWSPRAHPAGTISTPLAWEEVDEALDPTAFTLATALDRPDHWAALPRPQRIERARAAVLDAGYELVDRSPRARTGP